MQLNLPPITLATLKEDGTIRCLADVRYRPESRHSSTAFAVARNLADEITATLVAQLGQVGTGTRSEESPSRPETDKTTSAQAQAQLYAVQLHRNRIRVCFDVFLDHCTPEFRRQMGETVMRPIHAVAELGDGHGYQVERKSPLDARVARQVTDLQQYDKGPRPYFTDNMTMMCYDGYGIREEDSLEGLDPFVPSSRSPGRGKGDS